MKTLNSGGGQVPSWFLLFVTVWGNRRHRAVIKSVLKHLGQSSCSCNNFVELVFVCFLLSFSFLCSLFHTVQINELLSINH